MINKLLLFLLLSTSLWCSAQTKSYPITISLFNESTAIPFTKFVTTPLHPGLQIGTEFNYKSKTHARIFQTVNASYFYHRYLAHGIGLTTELGYEYRLKNGLAFSSLLGVGYLHTFATAEEFIFQNGEYVKKADRGNARINPSLSFDVGYYLNPKSKKSNKIFLRYQSWAEYPYSPNFIPVMAHINLHIGAKFFISKNIKKQ
ncbi:MAG: hypothetical protein ABL929_04025 [Ferruginibacter sp.]|nr:hypothetical protein [Ferruginibacter sp.]